jgi:hypothetical protein
MTLLGHRTTEDIQNSACGLAMTAISTEFAVDFALHHTGIAVFSTRNALYLRFSHTGISQVF